MTSVDTMMRTDALLECRDVSKHFTVRKGFFGGSSQVIKAVDGVSFSLPAGSTLGLVGESGCGKSTLGRCIMRSYDPTGGSILYRDEQGTQVDLAELSEKQLQPYRREIRMVFQDPFSSLNPRLTLGDIIGEPLLVNKMLPRGEVRDRVAELLKKVGMRPEFMDRYPNAFSGGQRQRIGIARALALDPSLVVADEAVAALDVSVRAQILNLMKDLQTEEDLTYLFISHDLGIVQYMSDVVAVMYVGRIVEDGPTDELYARPLHPYTEALLSAVPDPDPTVSERRERIVLRGEVADASNLPEGCAFSPRCAYAQERCRTEAPSLVEVEPGRRVACHFAKELSLKGIDHA